MEALLLVVFLSTISWICAGKWIAREKVHYGGRSPISPKRRSPKTASHSVTFYVKPRNMDKLEEILFDVSDPRSANYGKHWTREEVAAFTSNVEGSSKLEAYLRKEKIMITKKTEYGEYVTAYGRIEDWERIFATKFHEFEHEDWAHEKLHRALEYSLSDEINEYVESVFEVVDFPVDLVDLKPVTREIEEVKSRQESTQSNRDVNTEATNPLPGTVNPTFLIGYYSIDVTQGSSNTNQGAVQCIGQTLSSTDLTTFQTTFGTPKRSVDTVYGGHVLANACATVGVDNCIESNLDFQFMMAVGQNIPTISIYVNNSCNWLSLVQFVQNMKNPPKVLSISYASYEEDIPTSYLTSFNNGMIQLGVMGVTFFASSGDDGAVGFLVTQTSQCNTYSYSPQFPASSPYVTAVGGTQGPESNKAEIACQMDQDGGITTGGGFSFSMAVPSYQTSFISTYFTTLKAKNLSSPTGYGTGRGYPDISALANTYAVYANKQLYGVSGTSASSPVMAGIFALINSARVKKGLSTMGYLNPFLYQNYKSFVVDITSGNNFCTKTTNVCCPQGFYATTGWDPVVGLGVVNFANLLTVATVTAAPSVAPTISSSPSAAPSPFPSHVPTSVSESPTLLPTVSMSSQPTSRPSAKSPTALPTVVKSSLPTSRPSAAPKSSPPTSRPSTKSPTALPTVVKSSLPTSRPSTKSPTALPTVTKSSLPTSRPSTKSPTALPTVTKSSQPTSTPSAKSTVVKSSLPTSRPSAAPKSSPPTSRPSTKSPTALPTVTKSSLPTSRPSTKSPTALPTVVKSSLPTSRPSTKSPTALPTVVKSSLPTSRPSTKSPTALPTVTKSSPPTFKPSSLSPTSPPTVIQSTHPTSRQGFQSSSPTSSLPISISPTRVPTSTLYFPTCIPSTLPSVYPTAETVQTTNLQVSQDIWGISFDTYVNNPSLYSATIQATYALYLNDAGSYSFNSFVVSDSTSSTSSSSSVSSSSLRSLQVGINVQFVLTVSSTQSADYYSNLLTTDVEGGGFTTKLQQQASTSGATGLTTATSSSVTVTDESSSSSSSSSSNSSLGLYIGVAVAVVVVVGLIALGGYVYYRSITRRSYRPTGVPAIETEMEIYY